MTLLVTAALPFAAYAGNAVGKVSVSIGGVDVQSSVEHEKLLITVGAPDGTSFTKEVGNSNNVTLRLSDFPNRQLQDGTYTYDIRVVQRISSSVKAALAAARAADDDAAIATIKKQAGISDIVQSGAFTVINGSFVPSDGTESTAHDSARFGGFGADSASGETATRTGGVTTTAGRPSTPAVNDQVIPDDLIVQSSLCVGFDCVDGESFGTDTIRLKENNTRIKFDDTSTSAGYANNDWQLTANDQPSGGANKFSIDDITNSKTPFTIEANTQSNQLYLDNTSRIGVGNSAPGLQFHMTQGDTPAIRLEQTNTSGFTAQTWDIGANEANFFIRDLTGGSKLSFRIRPGAPTSSIDIAASGNVGVGTASPQKHLHVLDTTDASATAAQMIAQGAENGWAAGLEMGSGTSDTHEYKAMGKIASVAEASWTSTTTSQDARLSLYTALDGAMSERMRVTSAGSVGIGTTAPSSKLHVSGGDIRVTGGSFIDDGVTLTAPDYVFESDYNLMSIDKVRDFIKENKHLPNVPSAKEIKSSGLNMSQFQMRLLEKVEELTLYTLDQDEQIGKMKAENDKLMERLSALEQQIANQQKQQ